MNGFISPVNNIFILSPLNDLIASLAYLQLNEIVSGSPFIERRS